MTLTVSDTRSVTLTDSDNPDEFMSLSSKVAVGNRAASCAGLDFASTQSQMRLKL